MDLAEHLANQFEAPEDDEERSRFVVDNDGKANWALRMLAAARARAEDVKAQAAEQRALIAEWEEDELARTTRDERFFEGIVADYWRRQLEPEVDALMEAGMSFDDAWAKVKAKSKKLVAGTISATKGRDSIVIEDRDGAVAWCRERGLDDIVAVSYDLSKDALKNLNRADQFFVTPEGEKVPGVHVANPGVTYKATPVTG